MELWDAYDRNLKKIQGVTLVRGETIPEGTFHLVCDVIVRHTDGSYLLMKRDKRKRFGGMWEATAGGSAIQNESPLECAARELQEETGITSDNLVEVGRVRSCDTIYVEYLCVTDCKKDSVTLQEGETSAYKWVSRSELLSMKREELVTERMHQFIFKLERHMREDNNKSSVAQRNDWKTEPMPEQHETFVLNRSFSDEEMDVLHRGNIPQAMEDKWFWYMEGSTLWAHRSWTGYCIYQIDFKEDNHHAVTVNRDPEQYKCTSIEEDIESLNKLLDWWTQSPYDHYNEWLSETYDALEKADKV